MLVPNAALRFSPPKRDAEGRGPRGMPFFGPPPGRRGGPRPQGSAEGPSETKGPAVWILQGRRPQRVAVTLGLSDGQHTEIVEGLEEGAQVIVDMLEAEGG